MEAADAAATPVTLWSELPAVLHCQYPTRVASNSGPPLAAPSDVCPVLGDSNIVHTIQLVRAGQAEIITDSQQTSFMLNILVTTVIMRAHSFQPA